MDQKLKDMLMQQAIVVNQEVEMTNVLIGIDKGNKYSLHAPNGQKMGQSAEVSGGFGGFIFRLSNSFFQKYRRSWAVKK